MIDVKFNSLMRIVTRMKRNKQANKYGVSFFKSDYAKAKALLADLSKVDSYDLKLALEEYALYLQGVKC